MSNIVVNLTMRYSFSLSSCNSIRSIIVSSLVPRMVVNDPAAAIAGEEYLEQGGMILNFFLLVAYSVVEVFMII